MQMFIRIDTRAQVNHCLYRYFVNIGKKLRDEKGTPVPAVSMVTVSGLPSF